MHLVTGGETLLLNGRWLRVPLAAAIIACVPFVPAQENARNTIRSTERIILQYRTARDAFAPSRFVAVINGGISIPLQVTWDLPRLEDKDKKKAFDHLLRNLEAREINGVEFECEGQWLKKGFKLRITSIPQPTEAGRKAIGDNDGISRPPNK